jgi:hypothetical protein
MQDAKSMERENVVAECRFFVPNPDVDEEDKKAEEEVDEEEKGSTPAQVVCNRVVKKAGIGEYAGHVIATVPE